MQMTIRFVTSSCFFMSDTIWHVITVSEEKTSDGQRLISCLMMYKNNHFTPLWHTYTGGYEAGSALTHVLTRTPAPCVSHSSPGLHLSSLLLQLGDAGCTNKGLVVFMACIYAESPESQLCPIRVPQRESFVLSLSP